MTQSIIAKAFRGELVPTEASFARAASRLYESAEELLARIHALRPAVGSSGRRRGESRPRPND